jgi:hypothetical protein
MYEWFIEIGEIKAMLRHAWELIIRSIACQYLRIICAKRFYGSIVAKNERGDQHLTTSTIQTILCEMLGSLAPYVLCSNKHMVGLRLLKNGPINS